MKLIKLMYGDKFDWIVNQKDRGKNCTFIKYDKRNCSCRHIYKECYGAIVYLKSNGIKKSNCWINSYRDIILIKISTDYLSKEDFELL